MAPTDKKKFLFDESEDESDGGAALKVNDEYAKRFEHNKKREERHRLEEKFGKSQSNGKADEEDDSSDDETEDEDGYLATEELDAQLNATLEALRKKDPRIYDPEATFYSPVDGTTEAQPKEKKEKPVTLRDYHRERILAGDVGEDEEEQQPTYAQEQDDLKKSILGEIQAQMSGEKESEVDEDVGKFLKPKGGEAERTRPEPSDGMHPSRAAKVKNSKSTKSLSTLDVSNAEKDPQLYLSNFLAARAWIEPEKNNWQAFDSDEEDDDKADEWEAAYNLRFEDPTKSNEVLKSYARDVVAAKSVRREDKTGRKKKREEERTQKEAEKQERREQRNRLRNLKLEEAEGKLKQIKKAAGLAGKELNEEEWMKLLDDAWDNDKWEEEMSRKFGDQYYAEGEGGSDSEAEKKSKVKKPKWDDDIDIKDLVPDFVEEDMPEIALSDLEAAEDEEDEEDEENGPSRKRQKTSKDRKRERLTSQKEARKERSKLEALVDAKMDIDDPVIQGSSSKAQGPKFAYRDTWAESYGMTTRDILMAPSDAALNEYVGLKKLAHFRPADKKAKDKKRLGKKARLRQWRKETFGPEAERDGPAFVFGGGPVGEDAAPEEESNIIEGQSKKRKKRSGRKNKASA
ncbi:putative KRI1-like family-domain-containing protein [Seiridium unicorne]|uniref:KRI1-like family-domain-containing protein n=1 Tax=Seiridium unicorne TaxID=138068 RepID=A0ABR2UHR6_9PEZI